MEENDFSGLQPQNQLVETESKVQILTVVADFVLWGCDEVSMQ
jgi:hypothetical protein